MSAYASFYENIYTLFLSTDPSEALLRRALRTAGVMRVFAEVRGHAADADVWAAAGLLHHPDDETAGDIKTSALRHAGADDAFLAAMTLDEVPPDATELEALLVALDHLTRLIDALAQTRNPVSVKGLKVSAVQKRFSDAHFLPSVNRMNIREGARRLHWEIGSFTSQTIKAMLACEESLARTRSRKKIA